MRPTARIVASVTLVSLTSLARAALGDEARPSDGAAAAAGFALPDLAVRDRVGARIGLGYAELNEPEDQESGFTLFTIEPFVRVAVSGSLLMYGSVPVTWAAGHRDAPTSGGDVANVTGGVLYAPGGIAAGAELSLNVGHAPAAHAALHRFDLDHFADDTYALRLHAAAERRSGSLRLSGQVAVMILADPKEFGALVRIAAGAGLALPRGWTAVAEYLVVTDALEDRFGGDDDFFQAVQLGGRYTLAGDRATVGVHVYVPLDRVRNEDIIGGSLDFAADF